MTNLPATTRSRAIAALAALLAVAAIIAVAFKVKEASTSGENVAFVSAVATDTVIRSATATAEQIFTIRPNQVAATQRRADAALVGDGVSQYDTLYGPYLKRAHSQGITLRTTVRTVGIVWLKSDKAELLVFADQSATTPAGQKASGPAQLVLSMQRSGEAWKVSGIRLL
jgi:Mce-associated membrane protein